ncbi:MAG: hypothetical protein Q9164_007526, partial [Protoblastenia rupestris]
SLDIDVRSASPVDNASPAFTFDDILIGSNDAAPLPPLSSAFNTPPAPISNNSFADSNLFDPTVDDNFEALIFVNTPPAPMTDNAAPPALGEDVPSVSTSGDNVIDFSFLDEFESTIRNSDNKSEPEDHSTF